ncbi:MAG: hypothetical protein V4864_14040 [Pseudomonadota bacterium]
MINLRIVAISFSLVLSGCANLASHTGSGERGIDGVPCVGSVATSVEGLSEASNASLLVKAQMPTGKGGVCSAKVFSATAPVVLYRVFDASKPYTKFGGWWSLKRPGNSKPEYRAANAICPEWSNLDRLVSCEVRPGTQIVLGTTQSAECADGSTYSKTAETQVFVANDSRAGIIHVGACGEEANWP